MSETIPKVRKNTKILVKSRIEISKLYQGYPKTWQDLNPDFKYNFWSWDKVCIEKYMIKISGSRVIQESIAGKMEALLLQQNRRTYRKMRLCEVSLILLKSHKKDLR
jgi:hypothetical protein